MKISFKIAYRTQAGEQLGVMLDGLDAPLLLSTDDGEIWSGTHEVKLGSAVVVQYRYVVCRGAQVVRTELGRLPHSFRLSKQVGAHYMMSDSWRDLPYASYLFTSAFSAQEVEPAKPISSKQSRGIVVRAYCPCISKKGQVLTMVGEGKKFGNWVPQKALQLTEVQPNIWHAVIDADDLADAGAYKFVALKRGSLEVAEWEGGENRRLYLPHIDGAMYRHTKEMEVYFPSTGIRVAGTAIPVFSLRSEGSQGVGDFGDLRKMVDWCLQTKQCVLQILPINDTTATHSPLDSYPYNSISIYAFHPMYIDLRQLGGLNNQEEEAAYWHRFNALNALAEVDYVEVNTWKRRYLREIFDTKGETFTATKDYAEFMRQNAHWLVPYAAFSYLRDQNNTSDFRDWQNYSVYNKEEVERLAKNNPDVAFYCFLQYLLHIQLRDVSRYAQEQGVILKGDIPIGINRCSVEAWVEPHYFNMNGQAGAPPDAFSADGQNWGFPTYDWEVMEADGYAWWQRRFGKMAEYFTAYRIDHILGFFRIWEIPTHSVQGMLGQFVPALPMSVAEIEGYGVPFSAERMTQPLIDDALIDATFHDHAAYVREHFLVAGEDGLWQLKDCCNTQRKVQALVPADGYDLENWAEMQQGLYALINNVLFVPDRKAADKYHPRILGHTAPAYTHLNWQEREAFKRLHDDYFYRRHNAFWYGEAMKKLPALLTAAPMLACGEDLGMVPDCVPWVMNQLQIMSLEIQRMPKDPACEFGHVWEYPYRAVSTISTHDMSTLRGWWEEDATLTRRFFHTELGHGEDCPAVATADLCAEVVQRHLEAPSLLTVLAWQDWLSIDENLRYPNPHAERINIPANPHHYWCYRMHITLEDLMSQADFNDRLAHLITAAGRGEGK